MRWIVSIGALVVSAWFLSERSRRARAQDALRDALPPRWRRWGEDTTNTVKKKAGTARSTVAEVQATWPQAATRLANQAKEASSPVVQTAQQVATTVRHTTDDAAEGDGVIDRSAPAEDATRRETPAETGNPIDAAAPPRAATPAAGTPKTARVIPPTSEQPGAFIGNRNTRIFHVATASNLPAEDNRVSFETEEEALAAGFRPAEGEGLSDHVITP